MRTTLTPDFATFQSFSSFTMAEGDDGGGGFKRVEHTLESDFTLEPMQEDVVCVDLEGEWDEAAKIFRHPDFKNSDLEFISGEVGEGGDHMNITFKNLSNQSVTIKGDAIVVIVDEDPKAVDKFVKDDGKASAAEEEEKKKAEKEEKERLEKEANLKAEKEVQERARRVAEEKEAKERAEKEAKEKAEREAKLKAEN